MANDLITTDQNPRTPWSVLSAEPKLERLIAIAPGFSHVCSPDERAQLAALVPLYEAALEPASRKGCRRAIGKVALAYPGARLADDEAEARLELYADVLADVPPDVLASACNAVIRECRFFPTPAEIRAKCGGLAQRKWELSKVRSLIATFDRQYHEPGEPMNDEDRAAFARLAKRAA